MANKVMKTVNNVRSRMNPSNKGTFEMTLMSGQQSDLSNDSSVTPNKASSKEPVQVEPKTYFANERTFIQWISAALLLLTVSSIMMGSGSYNGTSSVIAFSSLILVGYASFVYFRRVKLLQSGNAYGYLDFVGPSILAAGVGLGVMIVFADAIKGSEFLPFLGGDDDDKDDRRHLVQLQMMPPESLPQFQQQEPAQALADMFQLKEDVEGNCARHALEGINLLEYQPRDILFHETELMVATPQALVSHPLVSPQAKNAFLADIPDAEIQAVTLAEDDRLLALSVGPTKTELIEFSLGHDDAEEKARYLIQESTSSNGSMVLVEEGKLYIYLDGTMHSYQVPSSSSNTLTRTGSINMKVINHGESDDNISAMEHFEGTTYILRENLNTVEAWDLTTATLLAQMTLPITQDWKKGDQWVGMAFERRISANMKKEEAASSLRKTKKNSKATDSAVYLHMPLDSFPPQLWSFRLDEHNNNNNGHFTYEFPECGRVTMN